LVQKNFDYANQRLDADGLKTAPAGQARRWLGRFAPSHRRCELPSAFWPALTRLAIKRLQRTAALASKLARASAADPQRR